MVSRSNLSGRPGPSGVLNRVMNPAKPRAPRPNITAPLVDPGGGGSIMSRVRQAVESQKAAQGNAPGFAGLVGRAAKEKSTLQAAEAGQKRGPRRQPTAREQAMRTQAAVAGTRGQAQSQRGALEQMGATQEEVATPTGMGERTAARAGRGRGVANRLAAETEAAEGRAVVEATGETGGTVTDAPVAGPSLNEARRSRSRSGRIYRR